MSTKLANVAPSLITKSEGDLKPRFAQVGACLRLFSERFEKESYPHSFAVSQDIYDNHRHVCR